MVNVYVFDTSLQLVTIYDDYKSLIWAKKYNDIGECELYIEATTDTLANLQKGYYLKKSDDDMLCRIKRIEIDTDAENGNYLIINGYDVKDILDQRIVWGVEKVKNVYSETYLRRLITENVISPTDLGRAISLVALAPANDLKAKTTEEIKYVNLGEKVREICKLNHWGYKAFLDNGKINFKFYIGSNKSTSVIFSPKFDNLSTTKTVLDASEIENVSLVVGGEAQGTTNTETVGLETGLARYESYVDASDVSNILSYRELKTQYPDGAPYSHGQYTFTYRVPNLEVQVVTQNQLNWLQEYYPNGQLIDGVYYLTDVDIADGLSGLNPSDDENVYLLPIVYNPNLATKGLEAQTDKKEKTTFEGTVLADVTYKYKTDYNLGDVVKIINELGIQCNARIIEMTETVDYNGYNLNPTFEYEVT